MLINKRNRKHLTKPYSDFRCFWSRVEKIKYRPIEVVLKISKSLKGKRCWGGRVRSPAFGNKHSDEVKRMTGERSRRDWQRPEYRRHMSLVHRKPWTNETRWRMTNIEWKKIRHLVLLRDGFQCRHCPSKNRVGAHHIVPWRYCRLDDPRNLISLCVGCHRNAEEWFEARLEWKWTR